MENECRLLIRDWFTSIFTAYLHCNLGDVSSFARKNFIFSTVVFRVNNSGGVFLLGVSSSARFFPAVQTICNFGKFIKIS